MTVFDLLPAIADAIARVPVNIPDPGPIQPPGTEGVSTVLGWLKWIGYIVIAGALVVGGILLAVRGNRGQGHDSMAPIIWPIGGAIVIGAAFAIVSTIMGG